MLKYQKSRFCDDRVLLWVWLWVCLQHNSQTGWQINRLATGGRRWPLRSGSILVLPIQFYPLPVKFSPYLNRTDVRCGAQVCFLPLGHSLIMNWIWIGHYKFHPGAVLVCGISDGVPVFCRNRALLSGLIVGKVTNVIAVSELWSPCLCFWLT